jgi:DNA-binding MarR family transcriptional regulator
MKKTIIQDPDYLLWWVLGQAKDVMFLVRSQELRENDITPTQMSVLFVIKMLEKVEGKATLSKIAEWLLHEPHTISRIVSRMVKLGFLQKTRDADKGIEYRISLTEKGEQAYNQSIKSKALQDVFAVLSREEHEQLYASLLKLRDTALKKLEAKEIPFP